MDKHEREYIKAIRTPDASRHDPSPDYIRELVKSTKMKQQQVADRLGISLRTLQWYISPTGEETGRTATYTVQYALEDLAGWRRKRA